MWNELALAFWQMTKKISCLSVASTLQAQPPSTSRGSRLCGVTLVMGPGAPGERAALDWHEAQRATKAQSPASHVRRAHWLESQPSWSGCSVTAGLSVRTGAVDAVCQELGPPHSTPNVLCENNCAVGSIKSRRREPVHSQSWDSGLRCCPRCGHCLSFTVTRNEDF